MADRWSDNTGNDRAAYMIDVDMRVRTLADEKRTYPSNPGTAEDEAEVTKNTRARTSSRCLTEPAG